MSYLTTRDPGKECRTNKLPPTGRIQERSKGEWKCQFTSSQPPRILLARIHLGWVMCMPPEGMSQNDWPAVTWTLQHHHKTQDCSPHGTVVPLDSLTLLLSIGLLLPHKVSCFVSTCVSLEILFLSVIEEPTPAVYIYLNNGTWD